MVGTLIESRAARQPRTGASVASTIVHAGIIAAAVLATARESISAPKPPSRVTVVYQPTRTPEPQPRPVAQRAATSLTAALPAAPRLAVPAITPTSIPPVDLSRPAIAGDFETRARFGPAGGCTVDCTATAVTSPNGVAAWSQADLMMQLVDQPIRPRYPEALRRAGIEGGVVVRFIVDTSGRVDMASLEVVRADHELFATAVRPTLERLRFNPATSNGRRIRVLAQMPFQFTLK